MLIFATISLFFFLFFIGSKFFTQNGVPYPLAFSLLGFFLGGIAFFFWKAYPSSLIRWTALFTVFALLFLDSTRLRLSVLIHYHSLVLRLCSLAFLVSSLLIFLMIKWLFPGMLLFEKIYLAILLSATDQHIISPCIIAKSIPTRIRQILSLESGLLSILIAFLIFITFPFIQERVPLPDVLFQQIFVPVFFGAIIAIFTALLMKWTNYFLTSSPWPLIFIAFFTFGVLYLLEQKILGVLSLGLLLGNRYRLLTAGFIRFGEKGLPLLFAFFYLLMSSHFPTVPPDWKMGVFSILIFLLIRPFSVVIALAESGFHWRSVLVIGLLGPKGIIPLSLGILLFQGNPQMYALIYYVCVLSIFFHGIVAFFLVKKGHGFFKGEREQVPLVELPYGVLLDGEKISS